MLYVSVFADTVCNFVRTNLFHCLNLYFNLYFAEPRTDDWNFIYPELVRDGVVSVKPAASLTRRGSVLLDVRMEEKTKRRSIPGSICIPLYQPIAGWDLPSLIRRVAFQFFGATRRLPPRESHFTFQHYPSASGCRGPKPGGL